jgi:NAD(P)-dependent dehydrogenase (short-subunit alcohol dehydrogenase family)
VSAAPRLTGRVVVTGDADVARAVAGDGAIVVLLGTDATALGAVAAEVAELGGRVAVLVGDLADPVTGATTRATLAELLHELFPLAP